MNKKVFGGVGVLFLALFIILILKNDFRLTVVAASVVGVLGLATLIKNITDRTIMDEIESNQLNFRKERSKKL